MAAWLLLRAACDGSRASAAQAIGGAYRAILFSHGRLLKWHRTLKSIFCGSVAVRAGGAVVSQPLKKSHHQAPSPPGSWQATQPWSTGWHSAAGERQPTPAGPPAP
ncbi:hypothetical protein HaLaN_21577 [Haematococcus lacustris]|uniref:Uncharacterized protein n=1 Tax=Haematococcus lacustris TaxID=44745 RepID=A0A699ZPM4_HAELA|nr:hypothetical protein HaLaN_21577 [Haematococcus lacustris]